MANMKQVFAAAMLAAIAITAIAYAQLLTGTITVDTEERLAVQSTMNLDKIPARAVHSQTFQKAINVTLTDISGSNALIGVELVADDLDIYKGFRAFVVQIKPSGGGDVLAVLTLSNPYAEFELNCGSDYNLDVVVIYAAGTQPVSNVNVRLGATIKAIY